MRQVYDASAALALLFREERGKLLEPVLDESFISSVNLSEAVAVMIRRGGDATIIRESVDTLKLTVLPLSGSLAIDAGLLWPATKFAGSSLGDRCALVLSRQLGGTLLTTDRRLAEVAPQVGVVAELLVTPGAGSAR
ncbi:PIN domain-containing protein [uncultured Sphingomonas sp.]|uniref:PIN domain-containing protein n=1 Tax=uncultured Sphingomonas sp. TaxID=158754 RepID=UPI0035CA5A2F